MVMIDKSLLSYLQLFNFTLHFVDIVFIIIKFHFYYDIPDILFHLSFFFHIIIFIIIIVVVVAIICINFVAIIGITIITIIITIIIICVS